MLISNIRFGFATNSSSSHSLVFNLELSENSGDNTWFTQEFGWDEFICNSEASKKAYFCHLLFQNLERSLGHELAAAVAKEWTGSTVVKDGHIDHQSLMRLPLNYSTGKIDETFFKELVEWHMRPEISIVGGNDNEEPQKFMNDIRHEFILPTDTNADFICKKDEMNQYWWTLFNKRNGAKMRLSFHNNPPEYNKSCTPELLDIKLTNFCPLNCRWCYQNSDKNGVHGNIEYIRNIIRALYDLQVFEVALGGGEPTCHPDFAQILSEFHMNNIVPNFTTRYFGWLDDPNILNAVKKYCGRFAVSVGSVHEVRNAYNVSRFLGYEHPLSLQYVMGSSTEEVMKEIFKAANDCGLDITLLGYKRVGRGESWEPNSYTNWIQIAKEAIPYCKVGIDTALASEYKEPLLKLQDKRFFTFDEGKFSMYIDAVTQRAAPSSFIDESKFVDLKDNIVSSGKYIPMHEKIKKIFSQF